MNAVSNRIAAPINVTKTSVSDQDIFASKLVHAGITSENDFLYVDKWFQGYSRLMWNFGNTEALVFGMWEREPDEWLIIHTELDRMIDEFAAEEAA